MKGEEVVELVANSNTTNTNTNTNTNNMFTKLNHFHQQQNSLHQYQHQLQQHQHQHQHQHHQCQTSDQEDESSIVAQPPPLSGALVPVSRDEEEFISNSSRKKIKNAEQIDNISSVSGFDEATIEEVVRRPRGRPPGSKNKPKPPIIITREAECAMRPHVLEISSGLDIVENISNFARKRNFGGLCVLNGSGAVSNVTLRQPSTTPGATVTFHGRFDILSISATYLPTSTVANEFGFGLAISLLGPQGQIFGGSVVGGLIASGTVFIVATSFATPSYHRLSGEEHESHQHQTTPVPVTSSACEDSHSAPSDSCGGSMSMYNSHIGSDAIWAPTARQPPPPPPPF